MEEKKKPVLFWVTLAVSIVLGLVSLVANYYSLFAKGISVVTRFATCFTVIAVLCGLMYFVYGAAKNAAVYYRIFQYAFAGVMLFTIASQAYDRAVDATPGKAALMTVIYGILLCFLMALSVGKDLGIKKTMFMAGFILGALIVLFVVSLIENKGLDPIDAGRVFGHLDLGLMLVFMAYAKYADKAARGSK